MRRRERGEMRGVIGKAIVGVLVAAGIAGAGGGPRCWTRYDPQFDRWLTECSDGARLVTRYDRQFERYRTNVVRPGMEDKKPKRHVRGK
jgi:hypothetical protein